jgi:hypothetical protein
MLRDGAFKMAKSRRRGRNEVYEHRATKPLQKLDVPDDYKKRF